MRRNREKEIMNLASKLLGEDLVVLDEMRQLIQKQRGLRVSIDPVVLVDFFLRCFLIQNKSGKNVAVKRILDIGTGNGIIPVLLTTKEKKFNITAVEIQSELADLAQRNFKQNGLSEVVTLISGDIRDFSPGNSFDYILTNPPYLKKDEKKQNTVLEKTIARHEVYLTLEELVSNAKRLLRPIGMFCLVHRTYRFPEVITELQRKHFSIGKIQFVHEAPGQRSPIFLLEAWKGKQTVFQIEEPLYLQNFSWKHSYSSLP
jgi:16S rRNA (guanine1207-N2)-methyltransferase